MWRALNTDEVAEPNAFAIDAAIAAFTKGADWLDEMRAYTAANKETARKIIEKELPMLKVTPSEATYLLWIDCSALLGEDMPDASHLAAFLRRETGLILSEGGQYGGSGNAFLRMNCACPASILEDGLGRFVRGIRRCLER